MSGRAFLPIALCLSLAGVSSASPITYMVTVNTSSILGTAGSIDFEFNPGGLISQPANLQILSFASNGTLAGGPTLTGDVSGTLPGPLSFDNGTVFNDYFEGFTFGSALSFNVALSGPALSSPNGTATSGSAFAFSMFSDAAGTVPALTTDSTDGFAVTVNVNLDGSTTLTNFSTQTTTAVATPEPGAMMLAGLALLGIGALGRRRKIF
jgi:uncharacterized protein (TIGR03382 family)